MGLTMIFKNRDQIVKNGQTIELKQIRSDILDIFSAAVNAVDPYKAVKTRFRNDVISVSQSESLEISDFENIYLVGFGKASVGMAQGVCDSVKNIQEGAVVTNEIDKKVEHSNVSTFVGRHPIPDENSLKATEEIIRIVKKCDRDDLLFVLISGGGSSLLCKPRVKLLDMQRTTDLLLKSGADINEINTIRKHLSFVKGGQLVKYSRSTVVSFIISDIIGDPLEFIASGPTHPDSTTYIDAHDILKKHGLLEKVPVSVKETIIDGVNGKIPETPKERDPIFKKVYNIIVANNKIACKAAEEKAGEIGYKTMILTTSLDGEAREVGKYLVEKTVNYINSYAKKNAFISGGETTVTVKGKGQGGRNQEMVLSSVKDLDKKDVVFASFATDGIDGNSDAAGAIADRYTFKRAQEKGLDPTRFLLENNSYKFFKELNDILLTGPTRTNVMDIQMLIKK
ncbi:MAG: glycerate kinase [Thermoplasmata archaeon]|nr:MAG: glycerate kinase [Thermoplasmata archaeon]